MRKYKKPDYLDYLRVRSLLKRTKKEYTQKINKEEYKTDKIIIEIYKNNIKSCSEFIKFIEKFYNKGTICDMFKY